MALNQTMLPSIQFEQFQERKYHFASSRQEYLGPWIDSHEIVYNKYQVIKQNDPPFERQKKKQVQFLSTLRKQAIDKKKRFRTTMHKLECGEKDLDELPDIDLCNMLGQKKQQNCLSQFRQVSSIENILKIEQSLINKQIKSLQHFNNLNNKKAKQILSTTVYNCDWLQPRKMSRLRNTRAISFEYEMRNKKNPEYADTPEIQKKSGNCNLQRILKMKEKLREKNSFVVKKIKQKYIKETNQTTKKQLEKMHRIPKWGSFTIQVKKGKERLYHTQSKEKNEDAVSNTRQRKQKLKSIQRQFKVNFMKTIPSKYFI